MPIALYSGSQLLCILLLVIITWISLLMECYGESMTQRSSHQKFDVRDIIIELQCYAKCEEQLTNGHNDNENFSIKYKTDFSSCRDKCRIETKKLPRPGYCPKMQTSNIFQNISPRLDELSCVDSCNYDFDCPEVQKCCPSVCGSQSTCMTALGLRDMNSLPPIPKILKHKFPVGHKVEITIVSAKNTSCVYHVEARSHIGLIFSPRKLGAWHWQPVEKLAEILDTKTKRIDVAFNIKPGRWYQVRVAAINSNGFRGYSEPYKPFSLLNRPKPPKAPADLKVVSTTVDGNFLSVKIVWCPSKSNLPVEKYKIIWSLYVKSKGDSLISNEAFVKNAHQFVITKLLQDSSYYIQVQAMSFIGKRRLKSEKTSYLYNTTTIAKTQKITQPYEPLKCSNSHDYRNFPEKGNYDPGQRQLSYETTTQKSNFLADNLNEPYQVRFLMNRKLGMIVRISGFHPYKEKVYELCPKETNCEQREYSAIRAKKNSLDFSKLKYNTTYMLKPFHKQKERNYDVSKPYLFTTPKCEEFRKKYPKMQVPC